ncbi:MAG: sugar transferase [Terriglobales bacterium]
MALSEATLIVLALLATFLVRFGHDAGLILRDADALPLAVVCALYLLCFYGFDLYEMPVLGDWREVWRRLPLAAGVLAIALALLRRVWPQLHLEALLAVEAVAAAGLAVAASRLLWYELAQHRRDSVLLVGAGSFASSLYEELIRHGELGLPLAGRCAFSRPDALALLAEPGARPWARRLLAAFPGGWTGVGTGLRERLQAGGYLLEDGAEWYEGLSGKVALPVDAADSAAAAPSAATLAAKRAGDCVLAAALLLVTAPLLLLVAVAIRLDSSGPAIFRQRRVGHGGRLFTVYKFRSMRVNADAGGVARPAGKHDPRCTRLGRWLRRLRLDELPQLVNILRGDMSLVGPRPFVPEQEEECAQAIPGYAQRWAVPPGATGWAQVNRGYCATIADNREKLAYDLFYIHHLSLWFDVLIILQTLKVVCLGRGGQ